MSTPDQARVSLPNGLAVAVARIAQFDGDFATAIPALTLHRRSVPSEPMHCIYGLGLGLPVQGRKQVLLGDEVFDFVPGNSLLTTVDLPVITHVTKASTAEPFLGLLLGLDAKAVLQLAGELDLPPLPRQLAYRPISLQVIDAGLADALTRMVRLLDEPDLVAALAPLVQREITIRLLNGPHGPHLRHVVAVGSPGQQIARSMAWLKINFQRPIQMDELAMRAHISPSTFDQHFRDISGMSPLQYQKQLRLQEARQLMLNESIDASIAGQRVGYESVSQFNREYSRLFGEPPQRDIRRLRADSSNAKRA